MRTNMLDTFKAGARRSAIVAGVMPLVAFGMLAMTEAFASATADPVDAAFTDLQGKVATYGAAVVALVVAGILIMFGIKWLRKGANKA